MASRDSFNNLWAELLEQKSFAYLVRSKIEQNLNLVISNITASFLGNRQLANHNTEDIIYNLVKICEKKFSDGGSIPRDIELRLLEHRQKLNERLISNSKEMLEAVTKLQEVHSKIMETNEEVVTFNSSIIELSAEMLANDEKFYQDNFKTKNFKGEFTKIKRGVENSTKASKKLSEKADTLFKRNLEAQDEIHKKREKILKNRARVSDTRKKIKLFL